MQIGLAFQGLYNARIDGIWGPESQKALQRYSESLDYEGKAHVFEAFVLADITEKYFSRERWNYRHLDAYRISFLLPERGIETAMSDEYSFNTTYNNSSLSYILQRLSFYYVKILHKIHATHRKKGTKAYTIRKNNLWITSTINRHDVRFYARSEYIEGNWTSIIVSTNKPDAWLLAAVSGSITPGRMPQLRFDDGYLSRGIKAANQLLDEIDLREGTAEGSTAPDSRPPDEGSASTPEASTPAPTERSTPKTASSGTGFAVSANGDLLTNDHVTAGCSRLTVDGHEAVVKATDKAFDLALVHAPGLDTSDFATFAENPAPLNSDVTVAGYPLSGLLSGLNITRGSVTAMKGLGGDSTRMQISAPVQPGNSGGPAMNAQGQVVGVVVAKLDAQRVANAIGDIPQNVNFAVRGSMAKLFLYQNGLTPKTAPPGDTLSPETIATRLSAITHFIECY